MAPTQNYPYFIYTGESDELDELPGPLRIVKVDASITKLLDRAFRNHRELAAVDLQEGLQAIGDNAFYNCESLVILELPSTMKSIGSSAFMRCVLLASLPLPEGLEIIRNSAFNSCGSFRHSRIPSTVVQVGTSAYTRCLQLTSLEIPENLSLIPDEMCSESVRIRNVALPSSAQLGVGIFTGCKDLEDVFPNHDDLMEALCHRFDGLPIHKFCYYQSFLPTDQSRVKNLNMALLEEPDDTRMHQDCLGMTPLHILACSVQPNLELCQVLVHRRPADIITTDKWGDLPIDYACYCHAPREIVQFLLDCHEKFFPKHKLDWAKMVVPCQYSSPPALPAVKLLLETQRSAFPDQEPDWEQMINFLLPQNGTAVLEYVLKCSVADRVEALGWKQHRAGIQEEIDGMSFFVAGHENVRRTIIALVRCRLAKYELKEAISHLLELALWKAKIDESTTTTTTTTILGNNVDRGEDERVLRKNCRVNCGAEIVVLNVMPFVFKRG
jgi:hypothetical protein